MPERARAPFAACLASAGAFLVLAVLSHRATAFEDIDATLLLRFLEPGSRSGSLTAAVTLLGDPAVLLPLLALACAIGLKRGAPRRAAAAFAVVAGANLTTQLVKVALAHPRLQSLLGTDQIAANSFPSGHATAVASIAGAYLFVVPREWRSTVALCGALAVVAVGSAVMALSWHYPSDVLGGVLVAVAWGFGVLAALRAGAAAPRRRRAQVPRPAAISVK